MRGLALAAAVALLVVSATPALVAGAPPQAGAQPSLATAGPLASASAPPIAGPITGSRPLAAPSVLASGAPAAAALPADTPEPAIPNGYRIQVPHLGIDLPIREGDLKRDIEDQRTPENFAFHLPGTSLPGENGNTYLYAHARRGMFLSLWNARPGDEVLVSAPDGRVLVYVVRVILPRVAPGDVSVVQATSEERLTLQTSTGPSPSDPRFVVLAFPRGG